MISRKRSLEGPNLGSPTTENALFASNIPINLGRAPRGREEDTEAERLFVSYQTDEDNLSRLSQSLKGNPHS